MLEVISLVLNLLLGSGLLGTLIFYRSKLRISNAEAEGAEIKNEQTEVDRLEARLKVRDDKVDTLYTELRKVESEKQQIVVEKHRVEMELEIMKIKRCDKRACEDRIPPSDY